MNRREAREKAVQTLFQLDNLKNINISIEEAISFIVEEQLDPFYEQLVYGTMQHRDAIDALLIDNLENWEIDRLPKIERTILRLAIYEIEYREDVPLGVVINEAIEVSKTFSDEKSGRFVNGVLSKFKRTK